MRNPNARKSSVDQTQVQSLRAQIIRWSTDSNVCFTHRTHSRPNFRLAAERKARTVPGMIRIWAVIFLTTLFLAPASVRAVPPGYERVIIQPVKTSIYVGSVTLTTTPFQAGDGRYSASYRAKVFPYFFSSEHGSLWIAFDEGDFARLERGELVNFTGRAENSDKEDRRIEGRAVPVTAKTGTIKVRVFVSKKIELIFNSTYRFE